MENKYVGYLLITLSILVIAIIFLFNSALKEIVISSCGAEHAISCPMNDSINQQTYLALGLAVLLIVVGIILILSKPKEKVIIKKVKEKKSKKKIDLSGFRKEDKDIFKIIQEKRAVFQADLIENTGFGKAKMSRIIDRLEGKGLVERKRRGLTNVVVIKE